MQSLLKISQQTTWQILGKIVTSFSTFIILGLVARNYKEAGTGVFTLSLTYLSIFYLLADFGFNAHILRKGLEDKWHKLFGVRIIWSILLVLIAVGLLPFLPFATFQFSQAVLFGSLAILGSGVFVTCNLIFQSKLRYDLSVLASSIGTLIGLTLYIYLIKQAVPVSYLLFGNLLSWVLIGLMALLFIRKFLRNIFPIYDIRYTINLFKNSWPIATTLALNVIYFRADTFMISILKSNADVGTYNLAYSVFQTLLVLPTFIMNAYYPILLKSFKEVKKIGLILLLLSILVTSLTYFLSPLVIHLLTAKGFAGSVQSLKILSLGFPAFFLSSLLMWVLVTKGKYKVMLGIYLVGLIVNFILNLIFIPQYSFIASSYITAGSEYLILLLQAVSLLA